MHKLIRNVIISSLLGALFIVIAIGARDKPDVIACSVTAGLWLGDAFDDALRIYFGWKRNKK